MSDEQEQEVLSKKEREDSKTKIYRIAARSIVQNTNPRHPFPSLEAKGWQVFKEPSLWALATSDSAEDRAKFVALMQENDPEFVMWAGTFLTQGQLQPVEVRDNGKNKAGVTTYTLVYGCRRTMAILLNWCMLGKPKEPIVEARLAKGNNVSLLQRAGVENTQRAPTKMEQARLWKMFLNNGQTEEEIARDQGVTAQTVRNRLALLELPEEVQKKVETGQVTATKALAAASAEKKGEVGAVENLASDKPVESSPSSPPTAPASSSSTPRVRPKKVLEEALSEFVSGTTEYRVLAWVLGLRDNFRK